MESTQPTKPPEYLRAQVPPQLAERVRQLATESDRSVSAMIRVLVHEALAARDARASQGAA